MSLEERVRCVEDELEIRNLLSRVAQLADSDVELVDYIAQFTEDAIWEGAGFPARKGHAEILAGVRERRGLGIQGPGTNTFHLLSTTAIDLDGDRASGRSVFHYYGNAHEKPELRLMGVYSDAFRRTEQGWKLAKRSVQSPSANPQSEP
jgi:ketosteroid isomerase-like protein